MQLQHSIHLGQFMFAAAPVSVFVITDNTVAATDKTAAATATAAIVAAATGVAPPRSHPYEGQLACHRV